MQASSKKTASASRPASAPATKQTSSRFVKAIYIRADGTKKEVIFQAPEGTTKTAKKATRKTAAAASRN